MSQPTSDTPSRGHPPSESLIDETIEETFPASDPPQLTPRATHGAASTTSPGSAARGASGSTTGSAPPTIGNQGTIPTTGVVLESISLGDKTTVTLRFEGDFERLHVQLADTDVGLDAKSLDRLIAALSIKRAQMHE